MGLQSKVKGGLAQAGTAFTGSLLHCLMLRSIKIAEESQESDSHSMMPFGVGIGIILLTFFLP